jgi:hypothetical protein
MNPTKRSDLAVRPPTQLNVPTSVPRNIPAVIAWDSVKTDSTITSSTTVITETNFAFLLTDHPQSASWAALYDQYCIVQATITFYSALPPGSLGTPNQLYTALDFDNVTALASIPAIEDYATSESVTMQPTVVHMRSVHPCTKGQAFGGSAAIPQRTWVDCAFPTLAHFGIRSIVAINGASQPIRVTKYVVFAFRNQI